MSEYESGDLPVGQPYTLQKYTFTLQSMYDDENDITGVTAKMTANGQTEVKGIDIEGRAEIESWSVEANQTEANVYAKIFRQGEKSFSSLEYSITVKNCSSALDVIWHQDPGTTNPPPYSVFYDNVTLASTISETVTLSGSVSGTFRLSNYDESLKLYYTNVSLRKSHSQDNGWPIGTAETTLNNYSGGGASAEKILIASFEIQIDDDPEPEPPDPGDDWEEPESTGDPDYTLKVKIIGALSGRHNDPLHDTSVSFTPADQISVKGYGGGGDGGHGGGGGAGASTIIVRRFVTDKAGSIEVTAISKRHGYGSGGGKGGRGGDGCILVFY